MATKRKIEAINYANEILKAIPEGVLLTTKAGGKINTMTIGWGTMGTTWYRPVFVAYIREHRFTISQLDKNAEFTVNIPMGNFNKKILGACGSNHGDKMDKIKENGLTLVDSDVVKVPGIKEFPLTLECKVIYRQLQDLNLYLPEIREKFYPQDVDSSNCWANKDASYTIFGEIVNAYIIE
ncbi:MAG: flavin reductase [Fibrobacter sp.]|nr:flavin reductase [Fibrobacter sp.]